MMAIQLLVWYEVNNLLFTLVASAVFGWWGGHSYGRLIFNLWLFLYKDRSASLVRYLLFWPVLLIVRLNRMVNSLDAFAAILQDDEN